jgi:hypothetical protein
LQGIIDEISPSPLPFPQREVGENGLFEPFLYIETIVLPRQARDKHREQHSQTSGVFLQNVGRFCHALPELGVPIAEMFDTSDLFELTQKRQMYAKTLSFLHL